MQNQKGRIIGTKMQNTGEPEVPSCMLRRGHDLLSDVIRYDSDYD